MMKKIVLAVLISLLVVAGFGVISSANTLKLYYDGKWHDYKALPIFLQVDGKDINSSMPPIVFGEYTVVPAREVFEAIGATVKWNGIQKTVTISNGNIDVELKIDSKVAKVNGVDKQMEIPSKLINDKTMIPTRFVSKELGLDIEWIEKERTVCIKQVLKDIYIQSVKFVKNPETNNLINVSYTGSGTSVVQIDIMANNQITNYNIFPLKEPNRVVVDIDNSIMGLRSTTLPVSECGIEQVRTSQFSVQPNKTRVVIDLQKELKYEVSLSSDKKHILINFTTGNKVPITGSYSVVIDPGHGGNDPGAVYSGITEKELNLEISLMLKKLLEEENIKVYMTRETDVYVDLYERSGLSNRMKTDLLLSIHNNAIEDVSYNGTMTLYCPDGINTGFNNLRFAEIIQKEMVSQVGTTNIGIRSRPKLAVLNTCTAPSALVEVACMTNSNDMTKLKNKEFLQKVAQALKDAIIKSLTEKG